MMKQTSSHITLGKWKQLRIRGRGSSLWTLLIVLLGLVTVVILPLIFLFRQAFMDQNGVFVGLANFAKYGESPALLQSLQHSLTVSVLTTVIVIPLAFGLAYVLTRTDIKGKGIIKGLAMLPLFAPTMMHGLALTYLFGNQGLFTTGFFGALPFEWRIPLYGPVGILIAEVIYTFPQAFLIMMAGLMISDYRLYEAADSMGASHFKKLWSITLPSVKYALLSTATVCFTLSFTDYGAPKVVGGQYSVLATDVYKQVVGQQNMSMGAVVGIMLTVPAVLAFILDRIVTRKQQAYVTSKSVPYAIKRNRLRNTFAYLYAGIFSLVIVTVMGAVVFAAFVKKWPYNLSLTMDNFNFSKAAAGGFDPFWNSVQMSIMTAVLGTVLIFAIAYLIENTKGFRGLRQAAYFLSILPMALPGLVIGLAFIYFFNHPGNPLGFMYGTMAILVLANILHFYSVPFMTATTTLKMMDKEFDQVSESMNVGRGRTFFRVTVPLSMSAILEMFVYLFVNSMVTISAVVFLYGADLKLASIMIVNMDDAGDTAQAAAMSVLIVLLNLAVRGGYEALTARLRRKTAAWQKR
ncbi:phosphonate ABC transporter permease [Paenibacillus sp. FSL H7-0326]|uniref:putative 2-aminoethylphosphonate ABC transporter permease subunit n=1 Tax=Paenibacillus sp. FSL H7-0326 TaxID=1921144 RepID=UPI00096F45D3|nr:putative 2-aminoethylphosphonate ABC transporter permease subunit [Paenibacillus sp. FSL H7-0326]OMC72205.1 phosphonate ABC transporter permease [Paenibacillus sp. FSL H7-0326]